MVSGNLLKIQGIQDTENRFRNNLENFMSFSGQMESNIQKSDVDIYVNDLVESLLGSQYESRLKQDLSRGKVGYLFLVKSISHVSLNK